MKPRIVFFGTSVYSLIVLEKLYEESYPIVGIVTKPDRPVGRKHTPIPTSVKLWADSHRVPAHTPQPRSDKPWQFTNERQVTQEVLKFNPELLLSADFTLKIPAELVNKVTYHGLNIHPSLLPSYRGPAPVPWSIIHGETKTGVTIVTISQHFDSGRIVAQQEEVILPTDTTHSLLTRLFTKGVKLLVEILPEFLKKPASYQLPPTTYNLQPSYYPRLTRNDGFEKWEKIIKAIKKGTDAARIERKFRAFHPWPGLWTSIIHKGKSLRLKLLDIKLEGNELKISKWQFEGRKSVTGSLEQLLNSLV